jgi:hypothetical protein
LEPFRDSEKIACLVNAASVIDLWVANISLAMSAKLNRQDMKSRLQQRTRKIAGAHDLIVTQHSREQHDAVGVLNHAISPRQPKPAGQAQGFIDRNPDIVESRPDRRTVDGGMIAAGRLGAVLQSDAVRENRIENLPLKAKVTQHIDRLAVGCGKVFSQENLRSAAGGQQIFELTVSCAQPLARIGGISLVRDSVTESSDIAGLSGERLLGEAAGIRSSERDGA